MFHGKQVVHPEKLIPMDTAEELSIRSRKQNWSIQRQLDVGAEQEVNMCEALEELMQDCREAGREEGREEGRDQGRQSELQEVCSTLFQIGTDEATIATLLHMRGVEPEQAAVMMEQCRCQEKMQHTPVG